MKVVVTICRWLVGLLFIFSGMVKANDPLGLSYKMLEFFEKWNMQFFDNYSLAFAVIINIVEVVAGIGIIIAWRPKFFTWLLLLLILFFTFLTSYVLFSGKIHACGCFGDCIPLTPIQTFTKDIVLLVLVLVILLNVKKIQTHFTTKKIISFLAVTLVFVSFVEFYALKHLPFKDCLAYKKGNNILEQMKPPIGSVSDSFAIYYTYKKDGKIIRFNAEKFPEDFDSTYTKIGEEEKVQIRKGNNTPKIANFSLTTLAGNDTTQTILEIAGQYVLIFVKDFDAISVSERNKNIEIINKLLAKKLSVFIVTNDKEGAEKSKITTVPIFICDATEIKTAARVNPTYFLMQGATILNKVAAVDADELMK